MDGDQKKSSAPRKSEKVFLWHRILRAFYKSNCLGCPGGDLSTGISRAHKPALNLGRPGPGGTAGTPLTHTPEARETGPQGQLVFRCHSLVRPRTPIADRKSPSYSKCSSDRLRESSTDGTTCGRGPHAGTARPHEGHLTRTTCDVVAMLCVRSHIPHIHIWGLVFKRVHER